MHWTNKTDSIINSPLLEAQVETKWTIEPLDEQFMLSESSQVAGQRNEMGAASLGRRRGYRRQKPFHTLAFASMTNRDVAEDRLWRTICNARGLH